MEEPNRDVGVEGWIAEDSPEVCGDDGIMTDQGKAGGTREPSGAKWTNFPGGAEGARSHSGADWLTVQGGTEGSEG